MYNAFLALGIKGGALDGNDAAKEGVWVDSAGQALTYTNWHTKQPSNNNGNQHYLEYNVAGKGQWNDGEGWHNDYVVCERPVKSKTYSL